jgi:hypothetical protein
VHGERFGRFDRIDLGMGMWASHESGVQHSVDVNVVDKPCLAAKKIRIFNSSGTLSNRFGVHPGCPILIRLAASSVAATML